MSEDITQRLMDLSEAMIEGMPYNDGDFTILDEACSAIEQMRVERDDARRERDEVRRMWCEAEVVGNCLSVDDMKRRARAEAKRRGWDCFKALEETARETYMGGKPCQ